jgi:hypothetical protein
MHKTLEMTPTGADFDARILNRTWLLSLTERSVRPFILNPNE